MTNPSPQPHGPVPSLRQLAWHQLETYGFIHFTTNTFTNLEWGYGDEDPPIFNPTQYDPQQWVSVAKAGGLTGLILTAKHHDGFCLWPSRFTDHSVKNSPWRSGGGDVVADLAQACLEGGIKFGVYLSPWDRHHPQYGKPEYIQYYRNQLQELLTQYGEIFEVWFDGANGGNGWYGGANERRRIDAATYYDWPNTWPLVRQWQPGAVMFSDTGPDVRWVGNEQGIGADTTWCTFSPAGRYPGDGKIADQGCGHENGTHWIPPETDVSIRPGWFYHASEDDLVKTPQQLIDIYFQSVGRGTSLLLNLPPDRRGLIHENDAAHLSTFKRQLNAIFTDNLAVSAKVSASSYFSEEYGAGNMIDENPHTYWAANPTKNETCWVELTFSKPQRFNVFSVQEAITLGQTVRGWKLQAQTSRGDWQTLTTGTTIGYKRLARFPAVESQTVRFTITDSLAPPVISTFGLFDGGSLINEPLPK